MFFKLSEGTAARRRVPVHCADATDGITPETGEAGGQPQVSKNGGAWANTTATLTAIGNGAYYVELTATELNTIGLLQVRYKSANTAEYQIDGFVFSYDPYDSVRLGLTALPNAAAEAAGGLYTRGTGAGQINQNANGQVDSRAVALSTGVIAAASFAAGAIDAAAIAADAIGSSELAASAATEIGTAVWAASGRDLSTSPPTAAAIGTQVWATAARTLSTSPPTAAAISTAVWGETVRALTDKANFTLAVTPPTAAAISTAVWAEATRTLTSGAAPSAATIADAVWDEVLSGHLTAGTTGLALNGASAPTAAAIADAVWDESMAAHLSGGSTGASLNGAGAAGDPWTTSLPGAYGAGTAGAIVGWALDATVSSRMATFTYTAPPTAAAVGTQVWATAGRDLSVSPPTAAAVATAVWASGTRTLTSFGTLIADIWANATRTLTSGGAPSAADVATAVWAAVTRTLTAGAAPTAAAVADAVWDESLAAHLTGGSTGNKLNSLTGAGGAGGITYTYTVTSNVGGLPIDDVLVWATTDSAGENVVASTRTNALGQAVFSLDAGSYYFWCSKSGINFSNPDLEVVS